MSSHPSLEVTPAHGRLDSWKEIAAYLRRSVRTVRRWEEKEGLPVHRLAHEKRGSVYAYQVELDEWRSSRTELVEREDAETGVLPEPTPSIRQRRLRPWLIGVAALGAAILALALVRIRLTSPPLIHSIAVLPFDNLSHNPEEEWFSDGMTETLITELAKANSLKVISRTSIMQYKGARKPLKQIASELGVDAVVEGSALRVGNHVRITAQLIDTSTDHHIWGNDFDRDITDALSIQREVAHGIAAQVGATLNAGEKRVGTAHPASPQVMAAYLKGLYQFNRGALAPALDLARDGVRMDPQFAQAHELLGMVLITQADFHQRRYADVVPEARFSLERALEISPERGLPVSYLGWSYFVLEHDWTRAEEMLRRGFEIDPATGNSYAYILAAQGKYPAAIQTVDQSVLRDPANPFVLTDAGHIYHIARRYSDAIQFYRKALELSPNDGYPQSFLPVSYLLAGQPDAAFEAWLGPGEGHGPLAKEKEFREQYRSGGWARVWQGYLDWLPATATPSSRLRALIFLHKNGQALDILEELEKRSDSWIIMLEDPIYDSLRQEPRFKALVKRTGYPQDTWQ